MPGSSPELIEVLGPNGAVARALGEHFESRPEQIEMAGVVARAMERRSHLLVEAGTGVGKSFAYLVPAILRAVHAGQTVVVATNTISLQEQLMTKDIPLLIAAMGIKTPPKEDDAGTELRIEGRSFEEMIGAPEEDEEPPRHDEAGPRTLKAVLVKGRGNYVSVRRLKLASQRQDKLFADPAARRSLHAIEDWAYATSDGTLSTLPPIERMGVWDKVQSDSGNCMGRKCPTYKQCFYQRARAELDGANLLVCNHALFFSDLALRAQDAGFLPKYDHVILDEAHNVEDVASDHFGLQLSEGRVLHLLSTLYSGRGGKGYLPQLALIAGDSGPVERAIALVDQASSASRAFFDAMRDAASPSRGPFARENPFARDGGRAASSSGRVREPGVVPNTITPAMRELSLRLKALKEQVKNEADKYELNAYAIRAEMIGADAEALISQTKPGCAYWVEVGGGDDSGRGPRVSIACSPIEVAPLLKEHLFGKEFAVVLTSATLATRTAGKGESTESAETAFAHAMSRLGCEGAATLQLGSPFDHARQVEFYVDMRSDAATKGRSDEGGREPEWAGGGRGRVSPLASLILEHVRATDGGAFVLFTSFASLNKCASELAGPLAELGLPLLAQGRDGSRQAILERFRENDRSVLFGAASFWQGVDVRGRGLRNVIITKLPFDPPDRPITEARGEIIRARGGDPFAEDAIPRAVIRFKQGFGRLIRSKTDQGRVAVLDPRIVTARYGRAFLRALPEGLAVRQIRESAADDPEMF